MRYWWVNQNQTYRQEVEGGYLWSPKRSASGARNPFYESNERGLAGGPDIFFRGYPDSGDWNCAIVLLGKPQALGVRNSRPELRGYRLEGEGGIHGPSHKDTAQGPH